MIVNEMDIDGKVTKWETTPFWSMVTLIGIVIVGWWQNRDMEIYLAPAVEEKPKPDHIIYTACDRCGILKRSTGGHMCGSCGENI